MNVIIQGEDHAVLDLVAHFLGLATHDNVNAAPAMSMARDVVIQGERLGPCITGTCHARFGDWPLGMHLLPPIAEGSAFVGLVCSA
ncbi:hypothetical protein HKCCSP123_13055 [Rhodobacterales bacterium HKCCSP123]|nr:hypothetical protein [Rhodobacterales bacterium HKCCSP123]